MAESKRKDTYANIAYLSQVESAANTLTFKTLSIATSSLLDKKFGLLINRCDLEFSAPNIFDTSMDFFQTALTVSDSIADLGLSRPEVILRQVWRRVDFGAAASGAVVEYPIVRDFSTMPGGGILVPADRLYIGVLGSGCSAAGTGIIRIYYTVVELNSEDYWQLVESRRILST